MNEYTSKRRNELFLCIMEVGKAHYLKNFHECEVLGLCVCVLKTFRGINSTYISIISHLKAKNFMCFSSTKDFAIILVKKFAQCNKFSCYTNSRVQNSLHYIENERTLKY